MKKRFYRKFFLYQLLIVAVKPVFRKMPTLFVKKSPEIRGATFNYNNQTSSGAALRTAPVFNGIYNPLTAAWLT